MLDKNSISFVLVIVLLKVSSVSSYAAGESTVMDTLHISSVSISRVFTPGEFRPGTKAQRLDSMILAEKANLSLAELLHENSPLFVKSYGRGSMATVSFRGTGSSHTKVYWNGVRVNSPMSGEADFSQLPIVFADDVSIHYGQASLSHGTGALGGAISLRSVPKWDTPFGVRAFQTVGSYQTFASAASTTYGSRTLRGQTRLYRESSMNNFSYQNSALVDAPVEVQQNADYQITGVLQEFYYRPNTNSTIATRIWAQEGERGVPKLMTSFSQNEENRQTDRSVNGLVEWNRYSNIYQFRALTGLSARELDYSIVKESLVGEQINVLDSRSSSYSWETQVGVEVNPTPWIKGYANADYQILGVETREKVVGSGYSGSMPLSTYRLGSTFSPFHRLKITGLLALSMQDTIFSSLLPSLSAELRLLNSERLYVRGSIGKNSHLPTLNDLYWQPGGNPNLLPEEGNQWELGTGYDFPLKIFALNFDAHIFSSQVRNWILWLPHLKGYWEPINIPSVRARGAEFNAAFAYKTSTIELALKGSYSYTKSSVEETGLILRPEAQGQQLPFIPIHSGGVVGNMRISDYYLVYTFTHFSERFTTTSSNPNSFRRLYPYYMNALTVGREISLQKSKYKVQLRVDNLFNESYQTILWRPMPGRSYTGMVTVDF